MHKQVELAGLVHLRTLAPHAPVTIEPIPGTNSPHPHLLEGSHHEWPVAMPASRFRTAATFGPMSGLHTMIITRFSLVWRLSPEGVESEPFLLKNDDIVKFGIDIIGEDNKTAMHHKVATHVVCMFTDEDAHLAACVEAIPSSASLFPNIPSVLPLATSSSGSAPPCPPELAQWLQGELQKSRETGAELHSLSTAMNEIHDMLCGSVPQNPVHPPENPALSELCTELHKTQASLASHVDKVCALEDMLAEHVAIKAEVAALCDLIHASSARSQHDSGMNSDLECSRHGQDDDDASSTHSKLHTMNGTNPLGGGLVTPLSPVSIASNPGWGKTRRQSCSRSPSVSSIELDDDACKNSNEIVNRNDAGRSQSPSPGPSIAGSEPEVEGKLEKHRVVHPLTPESSVTDVGGTDSVGQKLQLQMQTQTELHSASTMMTVAVGVLVLSIAAAAVLYCMKPE
ncbi:hypothetical protein BDR05DRAFT_1046949 [Suillus weaverae]|nr:hypothetical protein BDR05DRAFT_1046949 [Suillus weaverae]